MSFMVLALIAWAVIPRITALPDLLSLMEMPSFRMQRIVMLADIFTDGRARLGSVMAGSPVRVKLPWEIAANELSDTMILAMQELGNSLQVY